MSSTGRYTCPTPLEQAYASYLLKTSFPCPFLPISGRNAVVLLTRSNLPRLLLRDLWNIVDPQQNGKLFQQEQWWTLLKLVALAQQQSSSSTVSTVPLLSSLLYTPCPLPIFDGVTIPSPTELLQEQYSNLPFDFGGTPKPTTSLAKALEELGGGMEDAPLPSLNDAVRVMTQQENHDNDESEDDEFGDFANAPTLVTNEEPSDTIVKKSVVSGEPQEVYAPIATVVKQEKEFGGIEASPAAFDSVQVQKKDSFHTSVTLVPLSSALDALGSAHDAPLPSLDALAIMKEEEEEASINEFGEFLDAPPNASEQDYVSEWKDTGGFSTREDAQVKSLSLALEELGVVEDMPISSLEAVVVSQPVQNEKEEEFGDFEAPPNHVESTEMSNPFDSLGLIQNDPLPLFGPSLLTEPVEKEDDANEFGDFETPKAKATSVDPLSLALDSLSLVQDAPLPPLGVIQENASNLNHNVDEFGEFVAPAEDTAKAEHPLSLAFDALGPINDAPPPQLGMNTLEPMTNDKDDDFGDLEEPEEVAQTASDPLSVALDSLGPVYDAPLPSLGATDEQLQATTPQLQDYEDNVDEFGEFEGAPATETTILDGTYPSTLDECSPAFEARHDAQEVNVIGFGESASSPADLTKDEDPLSAAFESLGPLQDAPLPSLDSLSHDTAPNALNDNDDEFGDFEAPKPAPDTEPSNDVPDKLIYSSELDTKDAPLSSLLSQEEDDTLESNGISSGELQGEAEQETQADIPCPPAVAADAAAQTTEANIVDDDPFASAFDSIAPIEDSPLPPLGMHKTVAEDNAVANDLEEQSAEANVIDDDPFASAFDSIAPIEDSPLPPLGMHKTVQEDTVVADDMEEFGDFEETSAVHDLDLANKSETLEPQKEEPPNDGALDASASVEDSPLPTLSTNVNAGDAEPNDAFGAFNGSADHHDPSDEGDDDEFGGFEDALGTECDAAIQANDVDDERKPRLTEVDFTEDPFSAVSGPADTPLPSFHTASGSEFSGFETASENVISEEKKGEADAFFDVDANAGFGDFDEGKQIAAANVQEERAAETGGPDDDNDFGDFTAVEAPAETDGALEADWGDFEEPAPTNDEESEKQSAVTVAKSTEPSFAADVEATDASTGPNREEDNEFCDFGSFQEVNHPVEKEETIEDLSNRVKEMQKKLSIQQSTRGGPYDFAKSFDENIKRVRASGWRLGFNKNASNPPQDTEESMLRGRRCCQVMSLLTTSHESSMVRWEKIINVARDEVAMGSFLLEEAISVTDEQVVRDALDTMVKGLGEYIRVVRSIAATLSDLLAVDVNMQTKDLKSRLLLLDSALEVEDLWIGVERAAKEVKLDVPKLENIVDIRRKCLQRFSDNYFCQLTLQPLSSNDEGTTLSPVEWDGRLFMACAANFWSNRVSTDY